MGLSTSADRHQTLYGRFVKYIFENNVMGAYEPHGNILFIIRENVDDSNLDGLRLVVAHELVHYGQHVNHPELSDRVDAIMSRVMKRLAAGKVHEAMQKAYEAQPVMNLLETHALYVQQELRRKQFPKAKIESHYNLSALMFRLWGREKLGQYHDKKVLAAIKDGRIHSLYSNILKSTAREGP